MNKIYIATVFLPLETMKSEAEEVLKEMGIKGFFPVYETREEADNLVDEIGMGIVIDMEKGNGNTKHS